MRDWKTCRITIWKLLHGGMLFQQIDKVVEQLKEFQGEMEI